MRSNRDLDKRTNIKEIVHPKSKISSIALSRLLHSTFELLREPMRFILVLRITFELLKNQWGSSSCYASHLSFCENQWGSFLCYASRLSFSERFVLSRQAVSDEILFMFADQCLYVNKRHT